MNTYRQLIATACFLLISASAFSQDYTFKMDTVFKTVRNATYGKLRVIDMRPRKDNIGEVKTGAFNRTRPLVTEKPLAELMSTAYPRMIVGNRNAEAEMLVVLYHFELNDRVNGSEMGSFLFDADFFGGANGKYAFLGKTDTICEVSSGWDATNMLLKAANDMVNSVLISYATRRLSKVNDFDDHKAVVRRQLEKQSHPIFNTTEYKKGVYYTADQFLNNNPTDTPFIKSVVFPPGGKKEVYFYYPKANGRKGKYMPRNSYFAVYDGEEWFVPGYMFSVTMKFEEGDFYANLPFRGVPNKSNAAGGAAIIGAAAGGVIGGVVAATIAGAAAEGAEARSVWNIYRAKFDPGTKRFFPRKRLN